MAGHRPHVWARCEDTPEGEALVWRVHCTCRTQLPIPAGFLRREQAEQEMAGHLREAAPPEHRRCRVPASHRRRWWEECAACADQPVLAGMEHLAEQQ